MRKTKNTLETINKYNENKDEIYKIESLYNKKIHELTSIAISIFKKSFGKTTYGEYRREVLKNRELEWLFYTDPIRAAYRFNIESITDKRITVTMYKRTFTPQKREEVVINIPQKLLKMSDRDFAKLIRQHIKEYKHSKEQIILQNFDETLKERNNELKTLESKINYMYNLKKKAENKS